MNDQSWKGEHLIRATPRVVEEVQIKHVVPAPSIADVESCIRKKMTCGETARKLGFTYYKVWDMARRHGLRFDGVRENGVVSRCR